CIDPIIRPVSAGKIWVNYIDENDCDWTDTISFDVIPLESIMPQLVNIITPNSDGRNDELSFEGLGIFQEVALEVFNQDGNKLYQSNNYQNDWTGTLNGEDLPEGVYFYVLQVLLDDRVFRLDSDLTIVRD
ncbi:MAG: T9SS type B sorting domain-containing protein, partial [Saprospiraceae bacterium]|nr:T9SS type B sorting domain-containing protein [Saprospiraceae bacterium]